MKPSEELFELIQSLTKSEKRYFKLFSSMQQGDKFYVNLFDAIEKQSRYDEKKILNETKLNTGTFATAKHRLYNLVLKSMEHHPASAFAEVQSNMRRADFLYSKGLFKQSEKIIERLKETATSHEFHTSLLETSNFWEMEFALKQSDLKKVQQLVADESNDIELLSNTIAYRNLYYGFVMQQMQHGIARREVHIREIEKLIKHPLLKKESSAKTFEAKIRFYDCHMYYWETKGDYKKALHFAEQMIQLLVKNYKKDTPYIIKYIRYLGNIIAILNLLGMNARTLHYLDEIKKQMEFLKSQAVRSGPLFYQYSFSKLLYYYETGKFTESIDEINTIEKELKEYESKIGEIEKTVLYSNISIMYFASGNFKKSISWLNKIKDEISIPLRPDIKSFVKIFYLIAHYEAGHLDLVAYLIKSTHWFLERRGHLYKFEEIMLTFFRNKLPKVSGTKEISQAFRELKNKVTPLLQDPYEKNIFDYFDFIPWIESKVQDRPFTDMVREKTGRK